jgi:hypothetical protein
MSDVSSPLRKCPHRQGGEESWLVSGKSAPSLELIAPAGTSTDAAIIDIGGASRLDVA